MPEETTLEEAIRRNASGPKSAEVDGQKVEQHSLADQIAADGADESGHFKADRLVSLLHLGLQYVPLTHHTEQR